MRGRLHRFVALVISATVATTGCASARWNGSGGMALASPQGQRVDLHGRVDPAVMAEYVQRLPPGTTVRVDRVEGKSLRGTLIKATERSFILQLKTRIPEPAIEIAFVDVLRIAPESGNGSNIGKAIGIGAAAGAGAALAVFFIIIAALD